LAFVVAGVCLPSSARAGGKWTIVRSPNDTPYAILFGVSCPSADWCAAVGIHGDRSGAPVTKYGAFGQVWNGTEWTIVPTPNGGSMLDVSCVSRNWCKAGGYHLNWQDEGENDAWTWDGHIWRAEPIATPDDGGSYAVTSISCASRSFCLAVGYAVHRWNGQSWKLVTLPPKVQSGSRPTSVSCSSATSCVALSTTHALHWNRGKWSVSTLQRRKSSYHLLADISCVSAGRCMAVGSTGPGLTGDPDAPRTVRPLIEEWDGTRWKILPSPVRTNYVTRLGGVSCVTARSCTAVGYDQRGQSGEWRTLVESWDGETWRIVATPNRPTGTTHGYYSMHGSELHDVECLASGCTAVGEYQDTKQRASPKVRSLVMND
jgi:hypothetical protein